ncbi:MAG: hypothetical protein MUC60_00140 [Oscillatoria sp. Prado101]|nr:hypothetical protein [Oscillatoria sp. Prado101]
MKRIPISEIGLVLALASHGFTGSKMSPPAAPALAQPATASGRLIELGAECPPCPSPSPVPPSGYNQGH